MRLKWIKGDFWTLEELCTLLSAILALPLFLQNQSVTSEAMFRLPAQIQIVFWNPGSLDSRFGRPGRSYRISRCLLSLSQRHTQRPESRYQSGWAESTQKTTICWQSGWNIVCSLKYLMLLFWEKVSLVYISTVTYRRRFMLSGRKTLIGSPVDNTADTLLQSEHSLREFLWMPQHVWRGVIKAAWI